MAEDLFRLKDQRGVPHYWERADINAAIDARAAGHVFLVSTFSELRTLTGADESLVFVSGHTSENDGGGGLFVWDADNGGVDDNGVVILPTGHVGDGRWTRAQNSQQPCNVLWYGATGDGVTDDTAAVQAALDSGRSFIHIPAGTYNVGDLELTTPGAIVQGEGINQTILNYTGSGDLLTIEAGNIAFHDLTADGNGTGGTLFRTDQSGATNAGVYGFYNVRGTDAECFVEFGDPAIGGSDTGQADTIFLHCVALRISGDAIRVNHDQGVNYLFLQCTLAEIVGSALRFVRGGKMRAVESAIREVGVILTVEGSGDNSDYFVLNGVAVDGALNTPGYPQSPQLVVADSGRISVDNYSSNSIGAAPTAPLISATGYARVEMRRSQTVQIYTWDGATGVPVVYLQGSGTILPATVVIDGFQLGSQSSGTADYRTLVHQDGPYTNFVAKGVFTRGQFLTTQPDMLVGGELSVSGASNQTVPLFGSILDLPISGNYRLSQLSISILSGSVTGSEEVRIIVQRDRSGYTNLFDFTVDLNTTFPVDLIGYGYSSDPSTNYRPGDRLRVVMNDKSTGATPTLGVVLGLESI